MIKSCNCQGCFSSLGVKSRYQIYEFLKSSQKSVSEIVKFIGLKQPTVTYHLKQMEESGLLKSSKEGHFVYYKVSQLCPQTLKNCILVEAKSF